MFSGKGVARLAIASHENSIAQCKAVVPFVPGFLLGFASFSSRNSSISGYRLRN